MSVLHIVQAGIENGDYGWLKKAAISGSSSSSWVVPKKSQTNDLVVIFVRSLGFVATAKIMSEPFKREDWVHRYGASIGAIKLIDPPISLAYIRSEIPGLTWANYPRSITTPSIENAQKIFELIDVRRREGVTDLPEQLLKDANLIELRSLALAGAVSLSKTGLSERQYRLRSFAVRRYALARSQGACEYCEDDAPFYTPDGDPYLEVHHITQLSDDGPDDPENVIALCPNCHRKAHFSAEVDEVRSEMQDVVATLENIGLQPE